METFNNVHIPPSVLDGMITENRYPERAGANQGKSLVFYIFDAVRHDGVDLTSRGIDDRMARVRVSLLLEH